jgi:pilus assembly protein Flp/PilA
MRPTLVREFCRDEDGATAAEYAVMLVLIICAVIAAVNAVGNSTAQGWSRNVSTIGSALNGS